MIYQAMFDEVGKATAIFKCTNNTPVGLSSFLDLEGLSSDHYSWEKQEKCWERNRLLYLDANTINVGFFWNNRILILIFAYLSSIFDNTNVIQI